MIRSAFSALAKNVRVGLVANPLIVASRGTKVLPSACALVLALAGYRATVEIFTFIPRFHSSRFDRTRISFNAGIVRVSYLIPLTGQFHFMKFTNDLVGSNSFPNKNERKVTRKKWPLIVDMVCVCFSRPLCT